MKLNLEKNFKSLFKKKVSFTMAALTIFAITGAVSFANGGKLDENLNPSDGSINPIQEINKTNARVNADHTVLDNMGKALDEKADKQQDIGIAENAQEIERLDNEKASYRFVDSAIAAGKAALDKEKEEREKKDKELEKSLVDTYNGLNNRLVNEVDSRTKEDAKLATKIKQNKEAIADNKKAIEENKDAVQSEIVDRAKADLAEENARKAADKAHDKAIADNKQAIGENKDAIQSEIADRTKAVLAEENARKAADKKHDEAIDKNKKAIENLDDKVETHDMAIKALKNNKADKVETEKALNNLNENLNNEVKNRKSADRILKKAIENEEAARKAADEKHDKGIADNKKAIDAEVTRSMEADKKHDAAIDTNKKAIDAEVKRSKAADEAHDKAIAENKAAIKKYDTAIDTNKKAIEAEVKRSTEVDARHDAAIAANKAGIEANASAIKHLDSKLNKTTAMMTAMNNVDFQDVNAGEVAIGAGVGHFVGSQAVAVGVAYGVNDDLKVHAKLSGVAGDAHYNAIGGGVTYKFRTR